MLLEKLPPIELVNDDIEYAERITKCVNKCSYFSEQFMDVDNFDYNVPYLDCEERFICYRSGRQCGKSRNAAIKAIHFGYFAPLKASNLDEGVCNVIIASISKDQAYLIFEKISNFIHKSPTLTKAIIHETKTDMSIKWFNGAGKTNFIVRPIGDTGSSLRGYTTHMAIIDEAAYIPQIVYDAFLPSTVTTKPRIILASTPKGKCYSKDTDILTDSGWKSSKDIGYKDKVSCLIDGIMQYHYPQEIHKFDDCELLEFNSTQMSQCVTPNHDLWGKIQKGKWKKHKAEYFLTSKTELYVDKQLHYIDGAEINDIILSKYFGNRSTKPEIKMKMDIFCELLGWILSDGYVYKNRIGISQVQYTERLVQVLEKCPFNYKIDDNGNGYKFTINSIVLANFIRDYKTNGLPVWFKQLSKRQLGLFLNSLFWGDGDKTEQRRIFIGIYKKLADDVQELILKIGFSSNLNKTGNMWYVTIGKDKVTKYSTINNPVKQLSGKHTVYCVTVPGGLVFTRRKGKCCWSGNSGAFFNFCEQSYIMYRKGVPTTLREKSGKNKWVQFHVMTYDNPYANSDPEILEIIGGTSEASKKQELEGEFLDGGNSIIPYNLMREALMEDKNSPRFSYYELGVDTSGKGKDETVLITVGITEQGKAYPLDVYTELTTDQTKLARKIHEFNEIYSYRRIYYDETGMGDTLGDICRDRYPELPVYGINFKSDKTDLYVNLERLFEERLFNLSLLEPFHREKIEQQLAQMFWEYGKYKDQPPKARSDGYDDYSDATALSVYGQQKGEFMAELPDEFWSEGYNNVD